MNTSNEKLYKGPRDTSDYDVTQEIELSPEQMHEAIKAHFDGMELAPNRSVRVGRRTSGKEKFSSGDLDENGKYPVFTPGKETPHRALYIEATETNPQPNDMLHPMVGALLTVTRHASNESELGTEMKKQTSDYRTRRQPLVEEIIALATLPEISDQDEERLDALVSGIQEFVGGEAPQVDAIGITSQIVGRTRALVASVTADRA